MLETLQSLDEKLLLYINGMHNDALDWFFYWMSEKWIWVPLYAFLLFLYYRQLKRKVIYIVLAVGLMILLSDQTASHLLKNLVMRVRPCHNPDLADKIHLVNGYCGGAYGFVSSHAANSFALATFFIYTLGKKYVLVGWLLLTWAVLVSLSRVYLGVHYPGDVLGGALTGIVYAWLIQKVVKAGIQL